MTPRPDSQSRLMHHALQIIAERKQQVGPVAVTFTVGRIVPKPFASTLPAGDTGLSIGSPVNSPAASDDQGGRFCVSSEEITS